MSCQLSKYKSSGKSDSHYTIYLYNYSYEEAINFFSKKLDFVNKSIKDSYKKKMANNIIYNIKCELENCTFKSPFNYFILANQKKCEFIPFSKNDIKIAAEWSIHNKMFDFSDKFKIKYLEKLFSTNISILNFHFNNKNLNVKYVDFMKEKFLEKTTVDKYDEVTSKYTGSNIILSGISSSLDKIIKSNSNKTEILLRKKNVTNDEIIEHSNALIENKNNIRLERDIVGNINNEKVTHKFLFGKKEISQNIMGMTIKTLYIYENIYQKLYQKLVKNGEENLINFEVVTFKEKNSLENYNGMIGEKYY